MKITALAEVNENVLASIAACGEDEAFDPADFEHTEHLIAELQATADLQKKCLAKLAISASAVEFENLSEYMGVEPGELVDNLIEELQAAAKKITGDFAQTSVGTTVTFTATTTSASAVLASPSSIAGLYVGQPVAGTGIPTGATITVLSPLTISAPATASGSAVSLTAGELQVLGLSEWTLDWKRKMAEATTTDDNSTETSLGSTSSWSVKSKYMFLVGDTSQSSTIIAAIQSPQGALPWNFFPAIGTGLPAYSGLAYVDGITIGSGVGKVVGLDVSLKGTGPLSVGVQAAPVANSATTTGSQAEV